MLMFGIKAAVFAFLAALYNVAIGVWLSLVERLVRDQEAAGSNPVTPTTKAKATTVALFFCKAPYRRSLADRTNGTKGRLCQKAPGERFGEAETAQSRERQKRAGERVPRPCDGGGQALVRIQSLRPYRVFITDLTGLVWTLDCFLPEILFFIVAVQVFRTAFSLGSSGESRRSTVLV